MNIEDMTAEQLRELAAAKAQGDTREVDIDGLIVHIDSAKCKSWKAFKMFSSLSSDMDFESMQRMMDFIAFCTDTDEDAIVEHCGGENASIDDVVNVVAKIISECFPKK